jgi:hypothetical protein
MSKTTRTWPSRPGAIPSEHHFAIITGSAHDDGYGGTSDHVVYCAYTDRAEWEAEIEYLEQQRGYSKDYTALEVFPAHVERKIHVGVDLSKKV